MNAVEAQVQRDDALTVANKVRLEVARVKRELAAHDNGLWWLAEMLQSGDERIGPARIGALIVSCRGVGATKCWRMLLVARVSSGDKRVRDLTSRQVRVLCGLLRGES